jgi:hypothetical protein
MPTAAIVEMGHVFRPAKELGLVGYNQLVCELCGEARLKNGATHQCSGRLKVGHKDKHNVRQRFQDE